MHSFGSVLFRLSVNMVRTSDVSQKTKTGNLVRKPAGARTSGQIVRKGLTAEAANLAAEPATHRWIQLWDRACNLSASARKKLLQTLNIKDRIGLTKWIRQKKHERVAHAVSTIDFNSKYHIMLALAPLRTDALHECNLSENIIRQENK